jgi:hypothetical protein
LFLGTWWEQKDIDGLLMGIVWELDGKSSPHPFKKK